MGTSNEVFERIEKKYLMTHFQYRKLATAMIAHMNIDKYGLSTICNVYYDTPDYELIRQSIEKPVYKEKLRLRSYGVPDENSNAFIEIKKKYDGVVYKRRIELPMREARNYLEHGIRPTSMVNPQILKELDYFQQYHRIEKKMYIAYDRIAMYGKGDSSLRITLDFHIRAREEDLDLTLGDAGHLLFKDDEVLMEIKTGGAYPLWLADMLDSLCIYPVSFSKYGSFYKEKINQQQQKENKICLPA